jgi:cold shock CspA family protein
MATSSPRTQGTVDWFDDAKGWGFARHGNRDVFLHHRNVIKKPGEKFVNLKAGQPIWFTAHETPKGLCGMDIVRIDE